MATDRPTPLVSKLGIKEGSRLRLVHAPEGWEIDDLPPGVQLVRRHRTEPVDVVIAFFRRLASLQREADRLAATIVPDGALWLAWPRRAAGHQSDITDNGVRAAVLGLGLVDVKVAALGEDWSGLKLVWRTERRPGPG